MSVVVQSCPLVNISDCIISFIRFLFKNPDITPDDYRWNEDDRATKIFISGPYSISRDKVGGLPTITVIRGAFGFENRGIDNLKEASPNTFEEPEYLDLMNGSITVICEAGTSAEATGLANFIALEMHSNRHEIAEKAPFLHRLMRVSISQDQPTKEAAEIERWQCNIQFTVSLYSGWVKREIGLTKLQKISIQHGQQEWTSNYGEYIAGSDLFCDNSADFGPLSSNKPQLLEQELSKKWYFINIGDNAKPYRVESVIDNKTLKLTVINEDGDYVPFNPQDTHTNLQYTLYWNTVHISIQLPLRK